VRVDRRKYPWDDHNDLLDVLRRSQEPTVGENILGILSFTIILLFVSLVLLHNARRERKEKQEKEKQEKEKREKALQILLSMTPKEFEANREYLKHLLEHKRKCEHWRKK
jgi:hypothetical protein